MPAADLQQAGVEFARADQHYSRCRFWRAPRLHQQMRRAARWVVLDMEQKPLTQFFAAATGFFFLTGKQPPKLAVQVVRVAGKPPRDFDAAQTWRLLKHVYTQQSFIPS